MHHVSFERQQALRLFAGRCRAGLVDSVRHANCTIIAPHSPDMQPDSRVLTQVRTSRDDAGLCLTVERQNIAREIHNGVDTLR